MNFFKKNPVLICKLDPVGIHGHRPASVQRYQVLSEVSKTNPKLLITCDCKSACEKSFTISKHIILAAAARLRPMLTNLR